MNEFDGKKFYGFSLHDDPVLSTTTRNFEFKYTRPEHLERLIQKVQQTDPDHERNRKKEILNRLCKAKKMPCVNDTHTPYRRDADVETHVSRGDAGGRVRNLSDTEINQLIGKVKSYGDLRRQNSTDTYAKAKDTTKSMQPSMALKSILRNSTHDFPNGSGTVEPRQSPRLLCNPYEYSDDNCIGDGDLYGSEPTSEDQILCNPFDLPHEPLYESHAMHMPHMRRELHSGLCKLPDVPEEDELFASRTVMPTVVEEFRQPQAKWVEICAEPAMEKAQSAEIKFAEFSEKSERLPTNVTYTMHSHELQLPIQISAPEMMLKNMSPPPSLPNMALTYALNSYDDNPSTYEIEDSDLEYEMLEREQYTKYCGARPKNEELTNNSNGSGGLAEFVELESEIPNMNLSFLKNVSPLRYSDLTDEREEEKKAVLKQNQFKMVIKNRNTKSPTPTVEKEPSIATSKDTKKKCAKPKNKPTEEVKPNPRKKLTARSPDISSPAEKSSLGTPRSGGKRSSTTTPRPHKERNSQLNQISSNELRSMKNIILTKSIEDLKMEKMAIFAKMTSTQERIIETLDKLRISLLELYVPDSHYEKTRRQKNAFEFSVRFSRNFLYPLKGMIEDLRVVSVEQLCSAVSNEATQRVHNIFTLIHQSLQTYYKQLRYFLLDQVPQKLNTLIELASTTVSICLEKQIFDRNDAIIECLQERCAKFLGFLEDMHEERFLTARDNYRKASFDKTASNYSLKMFMNDLNMYEPKLVPKNHYNHRRKPKLRRVLKPSTTTTKAKSNTETAPVPQTSQMVITKPDGDQISTHINDLARSSGLFQSAQNIAVDPIAPPAEPSMNSEELPTLNKALIEALQTVTKEQMRQVLQPIMQTLGSVIEKKNASKTIEELLNAFSSNLISLAEGEQTKRVNPETYSGNGDKVRAGAEELKASKQTERQRNRHRQSNCESTKRNNEAAAFFGGTDGTANAFETAIGELSADDNDDDNYYDDDGFENDDDANDGNDDIDEDDDNGDGVDDGDVVDDDQARDATTEPTEMTDPSETTERSEPNEASDAVRYFRDGYAGKNKNKSGNINNNNNNNSGSNIKVNGSKIVVFDSFKLDENGDGESAGDGDADADGDGNRDDGDDVASESGSDFASFEGNSSSFDVVIAMKPDKNKVNEQQQQKQQQQLQYNSKKEQQQHNTEQQQLEKFEQQQRQQQQRHHKPLKLSKQQQQQQLLQLQMRQQQPERQQQKALRERTENYDTHIQQQQQLLMQQVYEEQKLQSQQQLAKRDERRCEPKTISHKVSAEQILKQSNNLQKQLKQQLEEHQRCIIEQQQQQQLHQQQLQQQKMLDRKDELKLQEKQKQHQQQQQPKQPSLPPPKPLTRKQLQAQAQQQARSTFTSRHTSRASTSRLPSSRVSPLRTTSRGVLSTRAKSLSSSRADMHADKSKLLKKRRNPLNSPPPAPSATPTNSARTPRSTRVSTVSSASAACNAQKVRAPAQQALRPSHTTPNMGFYRADDVGAGGDTHAPGARLLHAQSQMQQMCSMLKSEFVDMMIPLASDGDVNADKATTTKASESRLDKCNDKAQPNQADTLANHDLIEALTNCLFKYNEAMKDNGKNIASPSVATPKADRRETRNVNPASPITLYTGESPYEKLKLKKAQQRLKKEYQKEQRRAERQKAQKEMRKDANKEELNDWEQENSADEGHTDDNDYELPATNQQEDEKSCKNVELPTSPCTLWNSNFKDIPRKKDLHIEELIAERDQFVRLCSKNRFYANPNFNQPWRVFSKLAARLSNDIIGVIEEDFSIGVSKFVQDFLDNETKI
ncbi:uncharacterized protein LOC105227515 isoform X1 [Bactrocera dorsalis]|uniref:Uncharacterized protein LOC105227515 isoform X1 n=1 Tax=Bactrocera dorsalis TaxID=27457 RepID=A0ABM3JQQ9_BACDO|nr:uncharacterized protein LOC105227515 isoform X1 [Bactrocera dorsalis]